MDLSQEHAASEALLQEFDTTDWDTVLQEVNAAVPPSPHTEEERHTEREMQCPHHGPNVSPWCMEYATKKVMKHVVARVFQKCMDAKGRQELVCSWMFAHYKVMFGMLLGKVQPFKFALGFCMRHGPPGQHGPPWHHGHGPRGHHGDRWPHDHGDRWPHHHGDRWTHDHERGDETHVGQGMQKVSEGRKKVDTKDEFYFPMNFLSLFIPGISKPSEPRLKR